MFRRAALACLALLLSVAVYVAGAQEADDFFEAIDHPAIGYHAVAPADRIAQLAQRLANGSETLDYDPDTGYLPALLKALDIPVSSQLAVFSKTSLQQALISPRNPRAIYFNDSVVVAWPRGGFIEIASHDPRQGVMFYLLPQQRVDLPVPLRRDQCLSCHYSYDSGGVPGLLVRSVITGPDGEAMPYLGNHLMDDRTPFEQRWAGWFVTGSTGTGRHLGNQMPPVTRDLDTQVPPQATSIRAMPDALRGYLSADSDVVAHLVFDHQARVINLLTRAGWQARLAEAEKRDPTPLAQRAAHTLVDALLFIDEAPMPEGLAGSADFQMAFTARGPSDSKGRSLRTFDLHTRLLRYRCSFMIYSDAFDALPSSVLDAVYRRLWSVLSGNEKDARYASLTRADRTAILEILRDTKQGLPEYFR